MYRIIRLLVTLVVIALSSMTPPQQKQNPPKEEKKINPPVESPRFNGKLVAKLELVDKLEFALEEHITLILNKNRYKCNMPREKYVQEIVASLLQHTQGDIDLLLWVSSIAYVESSFRLTANPKISTARGFMQVIYRYHKDRLAKIGVSRDDLCKDPRKSILAGIEVFKHYLKIEHGDLERATQRYRGLSVSKFQQRAYLNAIKRKKHDFEKVIQQYA